jgi:hypothetical protein
VSTPRKHWFKVADSVAHEPWSNDVAATFMRLLAHLNTRWAREGRTPDQAVEVVLSRGTSMQLTGSGSLARARSILRELATHVSLVIDEQGTNTLVRWPKFAKFQGLTSECREPDKPDVPPALPPPQDARRKTQEEEEKTPADAGSCDSETEPPADPAPVPVEVFPPEAVQFAENFRAALQATDPKWAPPSQAAFRGWCRDSRALINKRGHADATELARWLFSGAGSNAEFWRGVVLCPAKFREKYDQLRKAKERDERPADRSAGGGSGRVGPLEAMRRIRARREVARQQSGSEQA